MEERPARITGLGSNCWPSAASRCRKPITFSARPAGFRVVHGAKRRAGGNVAPNHGHTQVGNIPLPQLNEANKALLDHLLKLDPKIKLEIANAIWIDQKASIKPDFIAVNQRDYDAEVANGNFQDPATVKKINAWVSARTHEKIPTILEPPLDPMLRLILLDAIYFKGDWLAPFDTNLTRDLPFTLGNGKPSSIRA
jgi:serine protease inhibitor